MFATIICGFWLVFTMFGLLAAFRMATQSADVRQAESQQEAVSAAVAPFVREYIAEQGSV